MMAAVLGEEDDGCCAEGRKMMVAVLGEEDDLQ